MNLDAYPKEIVLNDGSALTLRPMVKEDEPGLMEFFTDEPKRRCRCGRLLLREAIPQCAEWCVAAAQCLGQAIDLRELQRRVAKVKDDPRAMECLESIRERLQQKKEDEEG